MSSVFVVVSQIREIGWGRGEANKEGRANLEDGDSAVEEIDYLVTGVIAFSVAVWGKSVDACSMLVPLVLPERL